MSCNETAEGACLIIDPQPVRREHLCEVLGPAVKKLGLSLTTKHAPNSDLRVVLIVVDTTETRTGSNKVAWARRRHPRARVLVLSDATGPAANVEDLFRAGAHAVMEASADTSLLTSAISLLLAGAVFYSPRPESALAPLLNS